MWLKQLKHHNSKCNWSVICIQLNTQQRMQQKCHGYNLKCNWSVLPKRRRAWLTISGRGLTWLPQGPERKVVKFKSSIKKRLCSVHSPSKQAQIIKQIQMVFSSSSTKMPFLLPTLYCSHVTYVAHRRTYKGYIAFTSNLKPNEHKIIMCSHLVRKKWCVFFGV